MSSITCPNCGSPVAPGERFCGECGTDVSALQAGANSAIGPGPNQPQGSNYAMPSQPGVGGPTQQLPTYQQPQPTYPAANYQQPQQGGYNPQATPPTYQPTYSPNTTPMAPAKSGIPGWLGISFLVVAVVAAVLFLILGYAAAGQPGVSDPDSTRLGSWVCAFFLLLLLGIPGAVLTFMSRRR